MVTGLTDDDFRQIKKFAQTPRHQRTPELLCSAVVREAEDVTDSNQSSSEKNRP